MEKYEVIGLLGEGSFGRVYKAKQTADSKFVALKVISKRGKSSKEIKGLRRECEIQRDLHHPNIIQMLDSFETENEIVVITEFAQKQLYVILGKEGFLPEDRVQLIVWDLVSALYYLHSHRVLHRDLKPQNILLDANNTAKLCDFGFARNMSIGTHVLTSIKGTPLYMAPELIQELPYDHNADLWSLGCIVYELLVGAPPFCTASLLHLIRLIRHEQIQWPHFLSPDCISFLKGLLQKNPAKRLSWPDLLEHPFIKGHILISDESSSKAFTKPMTPTTIEAKEKQRKSHVSNKIPTRIPSSKSNDDIKNQNKTKSTTPKSSKMASKSNDDLKSKAIADKSTEISEQLQKIKLEPPPEVEEPKQIIEGENASSLPEDNLSLTEDEKIKLYGNLSINFHEDSHPLESEEWSVFLHRTTEEVLGGELTSLTQPNFTSIIIGPLRNTNVSAVVVKDIAVLLITPFGLPITEELISQTKKAYLEVKVIPNLLYSLKLLLRKNDEGSNSSTPIPSHSSVFPAMEAYKCVGDFTTEELLVLDQVFLLITYLVFSDVQFLSQFCDSVVVFKLYVLLQQFLLLYKLRSNMVVDLISILIGVLKFQPENFKLVHDIILSSKSPKEETMLFVSMLKHAYCGLREKTCLLLFYLSYNSLETLESIWSAEIKETLEDLVYDSIEAVRNVAERVVEELKTLEFYNSN